MCSHPRSIVHDLEHLLDLDSAETVRWFWPGPPNCSKFLIITIIIIIIIIIIISAETVRWLWPGPPKCSEL